MLCFIKPMSSDSFISLRLMGMSVPSELRSESTSSLIIYISRTQRFWKRCASLGHEQNSYPSICTLTGPIDYSFRRNWCSLPISQTNNRQVFIVMTCTFHCQLWNQRPNRVVLYCSCKSQEGSLHNYQIMYIDIPCLHAQTFVFW